MNALVMITRNFIVNQAAAQAAIALCADADAVCTALPALRGATTVTVRAQWKGKHYVANVRNFNHASRQSAAASQALRDIGSALAYITAWALAIAAFGLLLYHAPEIRRALHPILGIGPTANSVIWAALCIVACFCWFMASRIATACAGEPAETHMRSVTMLHRGGIAAALLGITFAVAAEPGGLTFLSLAHIVGTFVALGVWSTCDDTLRSVAKSRS